LVNAVVLAGVAQGTGPPLRPQGSLSRSLSRRPAAAPDPGASAAPGQRNQGQARACPQPGTTALV